MGEKHNEKGYMGTAAVLLILLIVIVSAVALNEMVLSSGISHDFMEVGAELEDGDEYITFTFARAHDYKVLITDANGNYITGFFMECDDETTMDPPYMFKLAKSDAWVLSGATVTIRDWDAGQESSWVWGE